MTGVQTCALPIFSELQQGDDFAKLVQASHEFNKTNIPNLIALPSYADKYNEVEIISDFSVIERNNLMGYAYPSIIKNQYKSIDEYARGGSVDRSNRPSPSVSATIFNVGDRKQGNDGFIWEIVQDKNGVKRWKKVPESYRAPIIEEVKTSQIEDVYLEGDISINGKLVSSFPAFKQSSQKIIYLGAIWEPSYDSETTNIVYVCSDAASPTANEKISCREAYEAYLWNAHLIQFITLPARVKNGLLLAKQNLID